MYYSAQLDAGFWLVWRGPLYAAGGCAPAQSHACPHACMAAVLWSQLSSVHPLQMTWSLDGQPYFSARSRATGGGGGWFSDGPGAGPRAPFDKVRCAPAEWVGAARGTAGGGCGLAAPRCRARSHAKLWPPEEQQAMDVGGLLPSAVPVELLACHTLPSTAPTWPAHAPACQLGAGQRGHRVHQTWRQGCDAAGAGGRWVGAVGSCGWQGWARVRVAANALRAWHAQIAASACAHVGAEADAWRSGCRP